MAQLNGPLADASAGAASPGLPPEPAVLTRLTQQGSLGSQVARGVAWTGSTRVVLIILQFATQAVVMRQLAPHDYGLVAAATVLNGVAALLADLGLTTALIRSRRVTERMLSAAFWLNAGISLVLTGVLWTLAPLIADYFGDPDVTTLVRLSALGFALNLYAVPGALLQRALQFKTFSSIETAGTLIGLACTLTLALNGAGAVSLVLGPLLQIVVIDVFIWWSVRWRPAHFIGRSEARELWRFGRGVTGANVFYFINRNIDTALVGRTVSTTDLGYYNSAYRLMMLPIDQVTMVITRVMLPAFSEMQDDMERLRRAWSTATRMSLLVGLPVGLGVAVSAPALIETVYGQKWLGMAMTLSLLGAAVPPQLVARNSGPVYQALGRTGQQFRLAAVACVITVAGIVAGLPWGIEGVATGVLVSSLFSMLVGLIPLLRVLGFPRLRAWSEVQGLFLSGGLLVVLALVTGWVAVDLPAPLVLLLQVLAGAVGYLLGLLLAERALVRTGLRQVGKRIRRRPSTPSPLSG